METRRYLTAREAAAELGVTLATLYAYVSRGLIGSEPAGERESGPGDHSVGGGCRASRALPGGRGTGRGSPAPGAISGAAASPGGGGSRTIGPPLEE